jgi:hypothetical protein
LFSSLASVFLYSFVLSADRTIFYFYLYLQLRFLLFCEQVRHKQVSHFACGFVEVEAHAFGAEALAGDVKLDAVVREREAVLARVVGASVELRFIFKGKREEKGRTYSR